MEDLSRRLSQQLIETAVNESTTAESVDFGAMVKGETPEDINEKCLKICQDFLSGDWNRQTVDSIRVRRVTGGLTNQLYHCSIAEPNSSSDTPQEVAIRLYGQKYFDPTNSTGYARLPDAVISVKVSDNKLGPQVYGLFEEGQLQKFYKHRLFLMEDQSNKGLLRQIMTKLAMIHSLKVPIKRYHNWYLDCLAIDYKESLKRFDIKKEIEENDCQTLNVKDFEAETEWARAVCLKVASPVVFTHNDFRSSNILITEPDDEILIIDYEYAAYGYRAQDFVELMREWGRDQWDLETISELPPEDSVFAPLVQIYVDECERIHGKEWAQNPINSVEHILTETKTFLFAGLLLFCLWFMKNDPDHPDGMPIARSQCIKQADLLFRQYLVIKQKLIKQGVVPE